MSLKMSTVLHDADVPTSIDHVDPSQRDQLYSPIRQTASTNIVEYDKERPSHREAWADMVDEDDVKGDSVDEEGEVDTASNECNPVVVEVQKRTTRKLARADVDPVAIINTSDTGAVEATFNEVERVDMLLKEREVEPIHKRLEKDKEQSQESWPQKTPAKKKGKKKK
ncbi:hypothetical protein NE237_030932 [Protea cynaroides]|uniref:Uncharacterized protein n=1 Tax=Protea cynaroides TaxID=273540 RepID=A0A9Q0GX45_9MAGN|nr:hypothetical protein NE237_030932 [Protea cynaroides]